jgi:predicted Fe-Mo cluster-binding NifX family protein
MNSQDYPAGVTPSSGKKPKGYPEATVVQQAKRRIALACLAAGLVVLSVAAIFWLGKAERIAVAATGQTPSAAVGAQAAQSPFLLIFDKRGALLQAIENPYKDQMGGGISLIDFLSGKGVTALVAGTFGPRIVDVMKGKGIQPVEFTGDAQGAVRKTLQSH